DLVDSEDVADRIAVPVQYYGRHRLFLLQFMDLRRQRAHLFLQLPRVRRQQEVQQQQKRNCEKNNEGALQKFLPGPADRFFFGRKMIERHTAPLCALPVRQKPTKTRNHRAKRWMQYVLSGPFGYLRYRRSCTAGRMERAQPPAQPPVDVEV